MSDTVMSQVVIHPLDDVPEQKLYHASVGRMPMTRTVRSALMLLQGYLAIMIGLMGWHAFTLM